MQQMNFTKKKKTFPGTYFIKTMAEGTAPL